MQNYPITNRSEKRSPYFEAFATLLSKFTMFKFKTILSVCLTIFTLLLVTKTLQIQHSCNPMIHRSGELPAQCQVATKDEELNTIKSSQVTQNNNNFQANKITKPEISQNITQSESTNQSNSVGQLVNQDFEDIDIVGIIAETAIVGVTAGIAGGVATVAAGGATAVFSLPVAGAVLIGLGIWFTIRTVF